MIRYRVLVAAVVLVAIYGCSGGAEPDDANRETATPAAVVVTAMAETRTLEDTIELSAEVVPWASVEVAAEVAGVVIELPVEVGDPVDISDVVARIDPVDADARNGQAVAVLAAAQAQLDQARTDLRRGEELATTNDISDGDLDRLRLAAASTAAQRDEASAALALATEQLEDTVIRAPFAGVISDRHVELGTLLSPGTPVVRLVARERVKVRAAASARDRARLRVGLPTTVIASALPEATFVGAVRLLGQEADSATSTFSVEVAVNQTSSSAGELLPGMQGSVTISLGRREAVTIPRSAVIESGSTPVVFLVEGTRARRVEPELGVLTPELAEVIAGLTVEDTVVVQGQYRLNDGQQVEVAVP